MTGDLRGKVVLITGASSGIGRAAALEFDRLGARVAMSARRRERLEENAAKMTDAFIVPADLADMEQVRRMVDDTVAHYGRLDILVNNAGETRIEHSELMDLAEYDRLNRVNFLSAVVATMQAVPRMRQQGGGHIVNVSSPAGLTGTPFNGIYSATKGAMCGWTRVLQSEWSGTGIIVSEYHPGLVASEMGKAAQFGAGIGDFAKSTPSGKGSWMSRLQPGRFTAEESGKHLVKCIRERRPIAFASWRASLVMHLAVFEPLRRMLGRDRRQLMRDTIGIGSWAQQGEAE